MLKPHVEWKGPEGNVRHLEIVDKIFFGRSCKGISSAKCVILNNPVVSRDHAYIALDSSGLTLTDMSANGVWVNNVRMTAGSTQNLKDGDTFQIGDTVFTVTSPQATSPQEDFESTITGPIPVVVTNLVADLRGFSGMVQKGESSDIYAVMREIFDAFSAVVKRRDGTVKDCVGDALYAFWDHGTHPDGEKVHLACQAAVEQAQVLSQIRSAGLDHIAPYAARVVMGWGMTTGEVTLAHYGTRVGDLALVGDCTNLAFRLSGIAVKEVPSELVMCSQTAQFLRDRWPIVNLGSVEVRGRVGREPIYGIGASKERSEKDVAPSPGRA